MGTAHLPRPRSVRDEGREPGVVGFPTSAYGRHKLVGQVRAGRVTIFRRTHRDLIDVRDSALDGLLAAGTPDAVVNVASGVLTPVERIVDGIERRLVIRAARRYVDRQVVTTTMSVARLCDPVPRWPATRDGVEHVENDRRLRRSRQGHATAHPPRPVPDRRGPGVPGHDPVTESPVGISRLLRDDPHPRRGPLARPPLPLGRTVPDGHTGVVGPVRCRSFRWSWLVGGGGRSSRRRVHERPRSAFGEVVSSTASTASRRPWRPTP